MGMNMADILYAYHYFVRHIIPGPQSLSYLVPHILLPIALLIPRSILSRWQNIALFIPVMVGCTIHAWTVMGSVDVPSLNTLFWALFLLVFRDPWTAFKRLQPVDAHAIDMGDVSGKKKDHKSGNGHSKPPIQQQTIIKNIDENVKRTHTHTAIPYPPTLRARLPWTMSLLSSLPLDNWQISHPPHDRHQPLPKRTQTLTAFILTTTLHATLAYLILDFTCALTTSDPYFADPSIPLSSPLPQSLNLHPYLQALPPHILRAALLSLQSYSLIACLLPSPALAPALLAALHLIPVSWSPHAWPPYFGSPKAFLERGLSGWWGTYWHQTMRWSACGPGIALSDWCGLRQRGLVRRVVVLASAFGVSGCVHMGLVPPEPLHLSSGTVGRVRLCVAGFFWLQALGILMEDVVRRIVMVVGGGRRGVGWRRGSPVWWWVRAGINVGWLCAWFFACMPLLGEAGRQLGWWRHWLVPISVWKGSRGEGWVAWEVLM